MPSIPVIGLAGKARTGKDTVAKFIIAAQGGYRYSLADPIRAMLLAGLGVDMSDPYWQANKEAVIPALGKSPRQMMQTLGTEWGRQLVNEDLWLILATQKLRTAGAGMVVTDIRFDNEAEWVRKMGGRVVHVLRPNAPTVNAHTSEAGVEQRTEDGVIINSGSSLEELQLTVKEFLRVV